MLVSIDVVGEKGLVFLSLLVLLLVYGFVRAFGIGRVAGWLIGTCAMAGERLKPCLLAASLSTKTSRMARADRVFPSLGFFFCDA